MIHRRTLDNGIRVITEPIESVRSCGVGLWIEVGSRLERVGEDGLTHFIEHMLFKGTQRLDARQIGDSINYLGGNVNAYTTQESLCLHAKVVDRKAHEALDMLAELLTESIFPPEEIRRERQVVLEECKMYEDSPEDLSVDTFVKNLWPGHPMGLPVIGSKKTIRQFSREAMSAYWAREFNPARLLIAIAGSFDAKACNEVIKKRFGGLKAAGDSQAVEPVTPVEAVAAKVVEPRQTYIKRPIEQSHFCLGTVAPDRCSSERFSFCLMNMVLGGGMSSRLFQEIREKRGLAYSIGSFTQLFSDRGFFAVSGGTGCNTLGEVLKITLDEMTRICEEDVSEHEMTMAREQVVDAMLLAMENTEARMSRLAESVLAFGRVISIDELIHSIQRVNTVQIRETAQRHLRSSPLAVSTVGPRSGTTPVQGRLRVG